MEPARTEPSRMEPARMELAEELQYLCRSCQIWDGPARQIYLVVRRTCQTSRMIRIVTFGCLLLRWLKFSEKKVPNHYPEHYLLIWIVLKIVFGTFLGRFEGKWKSFWGYATFTMINCEFDTRKYDLHDQICDFFGAVSKERFQGNSFCKKGPQAFFQGEKIMKIETRTYRIYTYLPPKKYWQESMVVLWVWRHRLTFLASIFLVLKAHICIQIFGFQICNI